MILNGEYLILNPVKRQHQGTYRCIAYNIEGHARSMEAYLNVKCELIKIFLFASASSSFRVLISSFHVQYLDSPVCRAAQKIFYGVSPGETVTISCYVEANPDNVTFTWSYANSNANFSSPVSFKNEGLKSHLRFTVLNKDDYTTIACSAINVLGIQKEPCLYTILPAGKRRVSSL